MKRVVTILMFAAAMLMCRTVNAQSVISRSGIENPDKWINTYFAAGKVPPFSFAYEEISSAKFITDWRFSKKKVSSPKGVVAYTVTWTDPESTVRVTCDVRGYTGHNAVEWVVRFKNISRRNTPKIAVIKAADYKVNEPGANGFNARYCTGTNGAKEDYQVEEFDLRAGVIRDFTPESGMSSTGASLPYYNIIARGADAGLVMAVGWTGRWNAELRGVTSLEYKMFAGLQKANFYLRPGEEVRTPLVATLFWKGSDAASGHNAFRRFVAECHAPRVDGALWTPLAGGFDFGSPEPCVASECLTEDLALAIVKRYKQFGIVPDVFTLERGWNVADGDWRAKEDLFPDGLSRLASLIHTYGSKLMVRFAPENIAKGTPIVKEHPEYILTGDKANGYVFDFSNPKAVDFICKEFDGIMSAGNIDGMICDVTGDLGKYWDKNDEKDRTGIVEMKYVAGLYRFWDYILQRYPKCALDNGAQGRRLDLEAVSRSVALSQPGFATAEGTQCRQYGLELFLPLQGVVGSSYDPYEARSCYGGVFTYDFNLFHRGGDSEVMRSRIDEYRDIQDYLHKDYYPVSGLMPLLHDDIWVVKQYHDRKSGSGIIVAFRRSLSENTTFAAAFRGLDPDARYELYDYDTKKSETVSGAELARGYKLRIPTKKASILLRYILK